MAGGKRKGAGKPKGSTTKPRITDFISPDQARKLAEKAMELALSGDQQMLKLMLEQYFGKAVQPVAGDEQNPIQVRITGMKVIRG